MKFGDIRIHVYTFLIMPTGLITTGQLRRYLGPGLSLRLRHGLEIPAAVVTVCAAVEDRMDDFN